MSQKTSHLAIFSLVAALISAGMAPPADAGPHARGNARAAVNRAPAAHAPRPNRVNGGGHLQHNGPVNAGHRLNSGNNNRMGNHTRVNNSNRTVNIDNHRDVNIDVDGRGRYGYDDHYHPIATAAAVTATVAVTAAVVGAIVRPTQLPSNCVQVVQRNVAYLQCGTVWYQPQYQGSDVTYVVVNAP